MCFVRENTSTPVYAIFGYDTSNNNGLQFEWILMEYMPGIILERSWRKISLSYKEDLVKKLAHFQFELFSKITRFQAVGNLFQSSLELYEIGSIVSMTFFWGDRGARDINRGPFRNSYQWPSARLNLVLEEQDKILADSDDSDEIDDA